jgi:hypothetical protein
MRILHTALGLSSVLVIAGATLMSSTVSSAQAAESSYVACNNDGDCWRVHRVYAYGKDRPITYHDSDWYDAHRRDEHIHWLSDPDDDRGYYDHGHWHADPGARAVQGGAVGAGVGAAIGCVVTLPVGCAPGAAVGAAVGGGVGAVGGAASTPEH